MLHRWRRRAAVAFAALMSMSLVAAGPVAAAKTGPLGTYQHLVVIYEENHSFDNLYGLWGDVNGQHLIGPADADPAHTTQVAQTGVPYTCLKQLDVNLNTDFGGSRGRRRHAELLLERLLELNRFEQGQFFDLLNDFRYR